MKNQESKNVEEEILSLEIAEKALQERTGDPEGSFPNLWNMNTGSSHYMLEFSYRKKNAKGVFTKKTYKMPVQMNYDPLSGKKLE